LQISSPINYGLIKIIVEIKNKLGQKS
jgi:hypothetical protein